MSEKQIVKGYCLCGQTKYEITGAQTWACLCHCEDCRRNCASPVVGFMGVRLKNFKWVLNNQEVPKFYNSSLGVKRYFCDNCGTPMAFQAEHYPGEVHLYAATLEKPEDFKPDFHVHYESRVPWLHIEDKLPKYNGSASSI